MTPGDVGMYFSWGNVEGHRENDGYEFTQEAYNESPAASIDTTLTIESDAANAVMGEPWRMPSRTNMQELIDNCTSAWTIVNGVRGRLFTSNINGQSIFMPAAGRFDGSQVVGRSTDGNYWVTTYRSASNSFRLSFNSSSVNGNSDAARRLGFVIRAIIRPTP